MDKLGEFRSSGRNGLLKVGKANNPLEVQSMCN